jgi:hypothetical protein
MTLVNIEAFGVRIAAHRNTSRANGREQRKLIGIPRHCLRADEAIPLRHPTARGNLILIAFDRIAHFRLNAVEYILIALQLIVALGILNVWMLRSGKVTPFRGGDAKNLREEFAAYGLPFWFMCVVGVLKVSLAVALIAAIWIHRAAQPAAIGLGVLMLGAFVMHLKVKDPIKKALPSIAVLSMCAAIALL